MPAGARRSAIGRLLNMQRQQAAKTPGNSWRDIFALCPGPQELSSGYTITKETILPIRSNSITFLPFLSFPCGRRGCKTQMGRSEKMVMALGLWRQEDPYL